MEDWAPGRNHSFLDRHTVYISFLMVVNVPTVCFLLLELACVIICWYVMECYVGAKLW